MGHAGDVGIPQIIQRDPGSFIGLVAAEIGGVDQRGAVGRDLGHKGIMVSRRAAADSGLHRIHHRKVRGVGIAHHVNGVGTVHGDISRVFEGIAAEKLCEHNRRTCGIDLRHEYMSASSERVSPRETHPRLADDIGAALVIHRDGVGRVHA